VVTTWRWATAVGAPPGASPTAAVPVVGPGVAVAAGRLASATGLAGVPGAVAATGAAPGKNVGCWPLWICHLSQIRTMDRPNTTQRMDRRMSFMTHFSFLRKKGSDGKTAVAPAPAPGHSPLRTRDGNGPGA